MAFWAAAGAILGLGSSIMGGMQQQSAAREANELAEKQAQQQYARAKKEWRIDWWEQKSNYLWDVAKTEAAKYVERQKEADHNWRSQKLIESAMANMEVNQAALRDRLLLRKTCVLCRLGWSTATT
jgi:Flp pilus assembly protein TadB